MLTVTKSVFLAVLQEGTNRLVDVGACTVINSKQVHCGAAGSVNAACT
jgi:hypothetical protein